MKWTETAKHDFLTDTGRSRADTDEGCQVPAIESDTGILLTRLARLHAKSQAFRYRDGCINVVFRAYREKSGDLGDTFCIALSLSIGLHAIRKMQDNVDWTRVKEHISEAFPLWTGFARTGDPPIIAVKFN